MPVVNVATTDGAEWGAVFVATLAPAESGASDEQALAQLSSSLYTESSSVSLLDFITLVRETGTFPDAYAKTVSAMDARDVLSCLLHTTSWPGDAVVTCGTAVPFVEAVRRAFRQLTIASAKRVANRLVTDPPRPGCPTRTVMDQVVSVMASWCVDVCEKLERELFPLMWSSDAVSSVVMSTTAAAPLVDEEEEETKAHGEHAVTPPPQCLDEQCDRAQHFFDVVLHLLNDLFTVTGVADEVEQVLVALYATVMSLVNVPGEVLPSADEPPSPMTEVAAPTSDSPCVNALLSHCERTATEFVMQVLHKEEPEQAVLTFMSRHWRGPLLTSAGALGPDDADAERGVLPASQKELQIWQSREEARQRITLFPVSNGGDNVDEDPAASPDSPRDPVRCMRMVGAALLTLHLSLDGGVVPASAVAARMTILQSSTSLFWHTIAPLTDALEVDSLCVVSNVVRCVRALVSSMREGVLSIRAETNHAVLGDGDDSAAAVVRGGTNHFRTHKYQALFSLVKQLVTLSSLCPHRQMRTCAQATVPLVLSRLEESLRVRLAGSLLVLCPFPSVTRFLHSYLCQEWTTYNERVYPTTGGTSVVYEEQFPGILGEALDAHLKQIEMTQMDFLDCVIAEVNFVRVVAAREKARDRSTRLHFSAHGKVLVDLPSSSWKLTDAKDVRSWTALLSWVKTSVVPRVERLLAESRSGTAAASTTSSFAPVRLSDIDAFSLSMALDGLKSFL